MLHILLALGLLIGCQEKERQTAPLPLTDKSSADQNVALLAYADGLPPALEATSVDVEVKGTAAEYKFAFSSEISSGCTSAVYGSYQSIDNNLQIDDLGDDGPKTVCIMGRSSQGTEQTAPSIYKWVKLTQIIGDPDTSQPQTPPSPKVTVEVQGEYHENSVELEITAVNGATHYQWGLQQGSHSCQDDFEDTDYSVERTVGADDGTLTLSNISSNGIYTLCLRPTDGAGEVTGGVSQYAFAKIDPPPPAAAGKLSITTSNQPTKIYYASATSSYHRITLSNTGDVDLDWKISSNQATDWLQLGMTKDSLANVSVSNSLVSGTLAAQQSATVWLRLADIYKTDYDVGKKTATLQVHNVSGEDDPASIEIYLQVPNVEINAHDNGTTKLLSSSVALTTLTSSKKTGKISLRNTAAGGNWVVRYQLVSYNADNEKRISFNNIVNMRRYKDDSHTRFIEFTVDEDKLEEQEDDYNNAMIYYIFTNTSSKDQKSTCGKMKVEGGKPINLNENTVLSSRANVTTNICYLLVVTLKK